MTYVSKCHKYILIHTYCFIEILTILLYYGCTIIQTKYKELFLIDFLWYKFEMKNLLYWIDRQSQNQIYWDGHDCLRQRTPFHLAQIWNQKLHHGPDLQAVGKNQMLVKEYNSRSAERGGGGRSMEIVTMGGRMPGGKLGTQIPKDHWNSYTRWKTKQTKAIQVILGDSYYHWRFNRDALEWSVDYDGAWWFRYLGRKCSWMIWVLLKSYIWNGKRSTYQIEETLYHYTF